MIQVAKTGVPVEATKNDGRSNKGELASHQKRVETQVYLGNVEFEISGALRRKHQWAVGTWVRNQEERGGWEIESKVLLESLCSQFPDSCWTMEMLSLLQRPGPMCSWGFSFPSRDFLLRLRHPRPTVKDFCLGSYLPVFKMQSFLFLLFFWLLR